MSFFLMETHCKACNKAETQEEIGIYSELRIKLLWWFSLYNFVKRLPHMKSSKLYAVALWSVHFHNYRLQFTFIPQKLSVFDFSLLSSVHTAEAEGRNG